MDLEQLLTEKGFNTERILGSSLPTLDKELEAEHPGTLERARELAWRLAEVDIDPTTPLEYGVPRFVRHAAEHGGDGDAWLAALERYVCALPAGCDYWSAIDFCLPGLLTIVGNDLERAQRSMVGVAELITAIYAREISTTRTLQYGVRSIGAAMKEQGWAFDPTVALAARWADAGADPGWLMQITLPAWLEGLQYDRANYEALLTSLEPAVHAVHEAGMHTGLPLATGLEALARYGTVEHLAGWLERILVLIRATLARELSAYGLMEYGLPNVARPGIVTPAQLNRFLQFGTLLADRGIEPGGLFADAVHPYDEASTEVHLDLGTRLAAQGIDPFHIVRQTLPAVTRLSELRGEPLAGHLDRVARIAGALHEQGVSSRKTFEDGFRVLIDECAEAHPEAVEETLDLAELQALAGIAPGMTLAFGVPDLLYLAKGRDWVIRGGLDTARRLTQNAINPATLLSHGVPILLDVCGDDSAAFNRLREMLFELIRTLEESGVSHRDVLFYDIPSMAEVKAEGRAEAFEALLGGLSTLLAELNSNGVDPTATLHDGVPAAARAARERPWVLTAAMQIAGELAGRGVDPGPCLQHGVGPLAEQAGDDEAALNALLEVVSTFVQKSEAGPALEYGVAAASQVAGRRAGTLSQLLDGVAACLAADDLEEEVRSRVAATFPRLARVARHDGDALLRLTGDVVSHTRRLVNSGQPPEGFLWHGVRAVADAADDDSEACARLMSELCAMLIARADDASTRALVELGAPAAARVAGADGFMETLAEVATLVDALAAAELGVRDAADQILSLGRTVARGEPARFGETLSYLRGFVTDPGHRDAAMPILYNLARLQPLLGPWSSAWADLVRPALASHGQHADLVLRPLEYITRHIGAATDFDILREVITQYGVRAPEILAGLIADGLYRRAIDSLTEHRETLSRFLRELPFYDPEVYTAYRQIQAETGLSERERRERSEGLKTELEAIAAAIRTGEVSAEQERSKLFGLVLYYVFPPAISSSRHAYERLYQAMPDRPQDVDGRDPGALRRRAYHLQKGAYELRPGVELDRSPWQLVLEVANAEPTPAMSPETLGWQLLSTWAEGCIGRRQQKLELLAGILTRFRAGGMQLPQAVDTPPQLIAFKEFLGDHVRDVVEESLLACQRADEERYRRVVRDKLAPPLKLGKGLIKGIWKTIEQLQQRRIAREEAARRLTAQLRGFVVDADNLIDLLLPAASAAAAEQALAALERREVELEPGKEVQRLLADLTGAELHIMNRELFGGPDHPAKLVYRISASSPHLALTFEVTKRKAHAVIGYAEGVCVATDRQLWDNPDFLQVIFWDPLGIAAGGIHLLIVEEADERYLTLPGINPSMKLLDQVEPGALLDAALDYAWRLARAWGLAGVWIPTSPGIHSNRRAVHVELAKRELSERGIESQRFSYSPYAYSFTRVFEVPERYVPEAE